MTLREDLLKWINDPSYPGNTKEELAIYFDIDIKDYRLFFKTLADMEREGLFYVSKKGRYLTKNHKNNDPVGKINGNTRGFAFFKYEDSDEPELFIPRSGLKGAIHGDKVRIRVTKRSSGDSKGEAEVVKILERENEKIIGTFQKFKHRGYVVPDNPRFSFDIIISKEKMRGAKNGDKVVAKLLTKRSHDRDPGGEILEIIGNARDKGIEIYTIAREYELSPEFPKAVIEQVSGLSNSIAGEDRAGRSDFSQLLTVTIDGADAKDFDDAISLEVLENGNYRLYVHIADVAHYVHKNGVIDKEALRRGNSVYLLDMVVPMLPEVLSNGLCSLVPGEERLTHTVVMEIEQNGTVKNYEFHESFIVSDHRLIYEDVNDFLEGRRAVYDDKQLVDMLRSMAELQQILYGVRRDRGALDFNLPEAKFIMDQAGEVINIEKDIIGPANRLIEEFMLITNETVGAHFHHISQPIIYRVHTEPTEEKLAEFEKLMWNFGYKFKGKELHPKDIQKLLDEVKGKKEEPVITNLLLRSMSKAKYSSEDDIHFGLATKHYAHFTAPIRRYSDLVVHRAFKDDVKGALKQEYSEKYLEKLERIAEHISLTEQRADEAERKVEDLKKAQYMSEHIGESYDAVISSLTNFGFFVQLENTVEGLIHFKSLVDDYYSFDEGKYLIVGQRSRRVMRLGDEVKVKLVRVSVEQREIDFILED